MRATFHAVMKKTLKAHQKVEELVAVVPQHTSRLKAGGARSIILDGETSTPQSRLGVLPKKLLQMDTTHAVERTSSLLPKLTSSEANVQGRALGRLIRQRGQPAFSNWTRQAW